MQLSPATYLPCSIEPPQDRAMTTEEQRGFRMACCCFATWGRQLMAESVKLGGAPVPDGAAPMSMLGKKMVFMAEALDLTIGKHGR